jgi:DNA-binding MarR family transcriptional regulator
MEQVLTIPALRALRTIMRASDLNNRKLAAATDLTPSQLLVLQEVAEQRETTPTALSAALQFSQATITSICDRLEVAGLVVRTRGEQDKRRIKLTVTDAGQTAIDRAPDLLQQKFQEVFPTLPLWEQALVLAGLERLCNVLGIAAQDAAPLLDSGMIDRA